MSPSAYLTSMIEPATVLVTADGQGQACASTPDGRRVDVACDTASVPLLSSRELLLTSLGSCLVASIEPLLKRHELHTGKLQVHLRYTGQDSAINAHVTLPTLPEALLPRLQRAAANCPVRKALALPVTIEWSAA